MQRRRRVDARRTRLSFEALESRRCLAANVTNVGNFNDTDPFRFFRDATTAGPYLYVVEDQSLVRSDGTKAGTFDVAQIGSQSSMQWADFNGTLYFQGFDATNGFELWRSDGTVAGTRLVKNLSSEPFVETISSLRVNNNQLFFLSEGNLYATDGTSSGTRQVVDVVPGATDEIRNLTVHNENLYFTAADGKFYQSDGTSSGTSPLLNAPSGPIDSVTSIAGALYFNDNNWLWQRDDGTGQFSRLGFRATSLEEMNGQLFYTTGFTLYKRDGATATTVADIGGRITRLTNVQGVLYFSGQSPQFGYEPYRSDGTPNGTFRIKDLERATRVPGGSNESSNPSRFIEINGQVYFMTDSSLSGSSPVDGVWRTDGTEQGTVQVFEGKPEILTRLADKLIVGRQSHLYQLDQFDQISEIQRSGTGVASFAPNNFHELNGQRFLFGDDGQIGNALYRLNADLSRTLIKDVSPGPDSTFISSSAVSQGWLYFATQNTTTSGVTLYRTDGTSEGTVVLRSFNQVGAIVSFKDQTILVAETPETGVELWKTDGSVAGTVLLKDINLGGSGAYSISSFPDQFIEFDGQLYFSATESQTRQIWVTDGTNAGTHVALDFNPRWMLTNQNKLYLAYFDNGVYSIARSDGTQAGTTTLATTFTDLRSPSVFSFRTAAVFNNMIVFAGRTAEVGDEVWKLASTGEPVLLKDINAGTSPSVPSEFIEAGGKLYFAATTTANGRELWETSGTTATTILAKDIVAGPGSSYPFPLGVLNGVLFFSANDNEHGRELWQTNGAIRGATLVKDIVPGPQSSQPGPMFITGQEAIFSATTPQLGDELWRVRSVAPVMNLPAVSVEAFREQGPVHVVPAALLEDRDNPTFLGGVLKVSLGTSFRLGDEVLLTSNSNVTLNRTRVLVGGVIVGTWTRSDRGKELTIIFNQDATRFRVQEVLRAVAFNHTTASPVPGQRSLRFDLSDGSGAIATAKVVRVDVIPLDTLPVISGLYGSTTSTLDSTGFAFAARAVVKDDNFNLAGGELQVNFRNSRDYTHILIELGGPIFWKDVENNVYKGSVKIGTMNTGGGIGPTPLSIVFNDKVTPATAQELLRSLKLSTPGSTTAGVRIPSIRISDGSSGFSQIVTRPYINIS